MAGPRIKSGDRFRPAMSLLHRSRKVVDGRQEPVPGLDPGAGHDVWTSSAHQAKMRISGKGDHRHYGNPEEAYDFVSIERLMADFGADVARLRGKVW